MTQSIFEFVAVKFEAKNNVLEGYYYNFCISCYGGSIPSESAIQVSNIEVCESPKKADQTVNFPELLFSANTQNVLGKDISLATLFVDNAECASFSLKTAITNLSVQSSQLMLTSTELRQTIGNIVIQCTNKCGGVTDSDTISLV